MISHIFRSISSLSVPSGPKTTGEVARCATHIETCPMVITAGRLSSELQLLLDVLSGGRCSSVAAVVVVVVVVVVMRSSSACVSSLPENCRSRGGPN